MKKLIIAAIIAIIPFTVICNNNKTNNKNMKKIAIIYASKHGTTEKVAKLIRDGLDSNNVELINLKIDKKIDLSGFEVIIIGGSIHAGNIQNEVRKFIKNNTLSLLQKNIALYLCCMLESQEQQQFNSAYPELLRNHSLCNSIVGGEYVIEKMNFVEKFLVRKITGVTKSISKLRNNEIDRIINTVKTINL